MKGLFDQLQQALRDLSEELEGAGTEHARFLAKPIPGSRHRIARERDRTVALLFRVEPSSAADQRAPIVLRYVAAEFDVTCKLSRTDERTTETGVFSLVRCLSHDRYHIEFFLRIGVLLLQSLPERAHGSDVARLVDAIADLFKAVEEPPKKTLVGFWAELLVLARATSPQALLLAWRDDRYATYDFAARAERIEIKCGLGKVRRHHFSLDQVRPEGDLKVLIGSMLTERSGAGVSVRELLERVRLLASSDARLALAVERVLVATLGASALSPLDDAFDETMALGSLRFFRGIDVPAPSPEMPAEVTQVSFWSDLTHVGIVRSGT